MPTTLHSSAVIICCTVISSRQKRYESVIAAENGPLLTKTATKEPINIKNGFEIWALRFASGWYLMIEKTHEFIKTAVLLVFCFSKIY